jgi:predicted dienelactone hydrolase
MNHNRGKLRPNGQSLKIIALLMILLFFWVATVDCIAGDFYAGTKRREERRKKIREYFEKKQGNTDALESGESKGAARTEQYGSYRVGYDIIEISAADAKGNLTKVDVAVWYPSEAPTTLVKYIYGSNVVDTKLAVKGKPVSAKFPLVIYSHGATGSGLSSAFLTERLASEGFVVAGIDHTDEYSGARIRGELPEQKPLTKLKMLKYMNNIRKSWLNSEAKTYRAKLAYRPEQIKAALDRLIAEGRSSKSLLYGIINEKEIGIVGHSFGAWTSMMVAGASPGYKDSRFKAIVHLSGPVNENIYTVEDSNDLRNIHIPIAFMYGSKEVKQGRGDDRKLLYDRANPPKLLIEIKGADHFTFSGGVQKEYDNISDYTSKDSRRAAIVNCSVAFFKYFLDKDEQAMKILNTKDSAIDLYLKDF